MRRGSHGRHATCRVPVPGIGGIPRRTRGRARRARAESPRWRRTPRSSPGRSRPRRARARLRASGRLRCSRRAPVLRHHVARRLHRRPGRRHVAGWRRYLGPDPAVDALSRARPARCWSAAARSAAPTRYEGHGGRGRGVRRGLERPAVRAHPRPAGRGAPRRHVRRPTCARASTRRWAAAGDKLRQRARGRAWPGSASRPGCSTRSSWAIAPVLLGDGVRLFDHPGGADVRLERIDVAPSPLATNLRFRVLR